MKNVLLIQENTFEKARQSINENKDENIIFSSDNDELNRKVIEKLSIRILMVNLSKRKDKQKQRDSGFNHVLSKIAKKKKIAIGINLDEIIESKPIQKAEILARVKQNIKICNKDKIQMQFISQKHQRNIHDLKSLGLILGMPTWMTKNFNPNIF